jgi:transglutaminase-like putative cysteine protease
MRFHIEHTTRYRYSRPVFLRPHTVRLCPRHDPSQVPIRHALTVTPTPTGRSDGLDLENNHFSLLWFEGEHADLELHCRIEVETQCLNPFAGLLTDGAERLPGMTPADRTDPRHPYLVCEQEDRDAVAALTRDILIQSGGATLDFLTRLNNFLFENIAKVKRLESGLQSPADTLTQRSGACRDLAWLFIVACRQVGNPARYVSGYQEGDPDKSYGDLHAWAEVYLSGLGWRGYDPTHGLAVADRHIVLAAAARPADTAPVAGAFHGTGVTATLEHQITFHTI